MKKYIFGIKAKETVAKTVEDFVEQSSQDGGNHNPYNKSFFNQPENMAHCNTQGRITSIPSPYARMHITDLAFQEINCGIGVDSPLKRAKIKLSPDYLRALSHCLDIYELLYHADEFNLQDKGITVEKLNLVSTKTQDPIERDVLYDEDGNLTQVGRYIHTLDLYRDAYMGALSNRGVDRDQYTFDFTSLYVFKYNGTTFAATSPFTGFFAKGDCDLENADLKIGGRKLLSKDPKSWRNVRDRDEDFRKFMYLMLRDNGLKIVFPNLYAAIEDSFNGTAGKFDNVNFKSLPEYNKFNLTTQGLQEIEGKFDNGPIYIRPDGLDCSYLKFLLYLKNPADLTIASSEYDTKIEERRFDGQSVQWLGVNDILSDALFVLPYDINDNYLSVEYLDEEVSDTTMRPRCLVPIKRTALDYFKLEDLVKNISVVKKRDRRVFTVSLKVYLKNEANQKPAPYITLRREYEIGDDAKFPNGIVIQGEDMMPFAFGVYPFVKSTIDVNIYKVLFYNAFINKYKLEFYYRNDAGQIVSFISTNHSFNKTNDIYLNQEEAPVNCEYHHLESKYGFEFAEVSLSSDIPGNEPNKTIEQSHKQYTSLIVPKLRVPHALPDNKVTVAIDLGTSNTYVAYSVTDAMGTTTTIEEINTHHTSGMGTGADWNELTFMNKRTSEADRVNLPEAKERNADDLILKQGNRNGDLTDEYLKHQLCEFIPSRIDPEPGESDGGYYTFPIPTLLNFLRVDGKRKAVAVSNPLINTSIPFAYYERGKRLGSQATYYDSIVAGDKFKWYMKRDQYGNWPTDENSSAAFKAFVNELLFIVRCHILSGGYSLKNVSILWSYPLAFHPNLVEDYKLTWQEAYRKIISRDDSNVHYTNESRSPIFECVNDPTLNHLLTVLIDIGGGSTDVIGYRYQAPQFITSFGFAGNSLYLGGSMNGIDDEHSKETVIMDYVKRHPLFANGNAGGRVAPSSRKIQSKPVSIDDDPVSTIMNYGFAKDPRFGNSIFINEGPKYLLLLHNAAIIYHVAQLCCIKSPDEFPSGIYLTGNGSKLFNLNPEHKAHIRKIFEYVYKMNPESAKCVDEASADDMVITRPKNPKAATALGAIKGFNKKQLLVGEESVQSSVIMLGDAEHIATKVNGEGDFSEVDNSIAKVKKNVEDFIDMFYQVVYPTTHPVITKEALLRMLNKQAQDTNRLRLDNGRATDSLFFQLISLLMEKVAYALPGPDGRSNINR